MNFPYFKIERKRKKGADGAKVRGTESIHKERPQISFEARVTQLKDAGTDGIAIRVKRETGQRGVMTKRWRLSEVDLSTFDAEVLAEGGGGSYTAEFLLNKVPMTLEGSTRIESYEFEIAGPPKTTEKKKEPEPKTGLDLEKIISKLLSEPEKLLSLVTGLNVLFGRNGRQSQTEMLQALTEVMKNLKETAGSDELERLERMMAITQSMRPPVQTTGPVAGPGFVEQVVRGASPLIEKVLAGQTVIGQTPAIGGTPTAQLPQTTAGTQPPQTTSGGALPAWLSAVPQYHQHIPILDIQQMIVNKADPDQVATYIMDAVESCSRYRGTDALVFTPDAPVEFRYWEEEPGIAFERFWADIPELPADEEYKQLVRAEALNRVEAYRLGQMTSDVDESDNIPQSEPALQPEPERALQPEPDGESGTHAVDGEPATSGEDAVAESASQRDG